MPVVLRHLWSWLLLLVWAAWWGGLSFYALVVIPIGTAHLGSLDQGFITQRVTQWHNFLTAFFLLCLGVEAFRQQRRGLWWLVAMLAVVEVGLLGWHRQLTKLMDFADFSVPGHFYDQHAIYLWLTAAEWLLGIIVPAMLIRLPLIHTSAAMGQARSPDAMARD